MKKFTFILIIINLTLLSSITGKELSRNATVPLLEKYCFKCHDNDVQKGDFNLEKIILEKNMAPNIKDWQRVSEVLANREMPPVGKKKKNKQPTENEIISLTQNIDKGLKSIDWNKNKHAGHVSLPFLSHKEYFNSIRDLLYWDHGFHKELGPEIIGPGGFSTVRDALSIRESQLFKYITVSDHILSDYFASAGPQADRHFEAENMQTDMTDHPKFGQLLGLHLNTIHQTVNFEQSGFYEITIKAWAYRRQKGKINSLNFLIDNKKVGRFRVLATERQPAELKLVVKIDKGPRILQMNRDLIQATYDECKLEIPPPNKFTKQLYHNYDPQNAVAVDYFKIKGPLKALPSGALTSPLKMAKNDFDVKKFKEDSKRIYKTVNAKAKADSKFKDHYWGEVLKMYRQAGYSEVQVHIYDKHYDKTIALHYNIANRNKDFSNFIEKKLSPKYTGTVWGEPTETLLFKKLPVLSKVLFAKSTETKNSQINAAHKIIKRFVSRAFRRPVKSQELARFIDLFKNEMDKGLSYHVALKRVIHSILCSPNFLIRMESYDSNKNSPLNNYELAARLASFLWQSIPDDQLYSLATKNKLQDPVILRNQVKRMLKSPKAQSFYQTFPREWLTYYNLGKSVQLDRKVFPEFNEELIKSMEKECELFFQDLVYNNRSLYNLIDSKFSYVNKDLAPPLWHKRFQRH